ncbi:RPS3 [Symbiodinium sp. CCMP2592]|nr:RPS3 [Symbiodinium sp. CCMP2592]
MAPAYVFYEAVEAFLKKEWARWGFRKVEIGRREREDGAHVEVIAVVRNTRQALGEKGCEIRRVQHKLELTFGFPSGSVQMYLEREDIFKDMSLEEIEDRLAQKGKKGRGKGKVKGKEDDSDGSGSDREKGKGRMQGRDEDSADAESVEEDPMPSRGYGGKGHTKHKPREPTTTQRREGDRLFTDEEHRKSLDRLLDIQARLEAKKHELPLVEEPMKQQYRYALRLWRELSLRIGPSPPPPDVPVQIYGGDALPSPFSVPTGDWGADDWGAPSPLLDWGDPIAVDWASPPVDKGSAGGASGAQVSRKLHILGSSEIQTLQLQASARVSDLLEQLREERGIPKKREIQLVLMPSGQVLDEDNPISGLPADEELTLIL